MDIEKIRFTNKNLNIIQTHPKYIGSGRSGCSGLAHLKLEVAMWQLILHIYILPPKKLFIYNCAIVSGSGCTDNPNAKRITEQPGSN